MAEAQPALKVRRELHLRTTLDGVHLFIVGENCDGIERVEGGYEIHRGSASDWVSDDRVDRYRQDPRTGFAHEQANRNGDLPSFARAEADGSYSCRECGFNRPKLHAIRVHYGTVHGGDR